MESNPHKNCSLGKYVNINCEVNASRRNKEWNKHKGIKCQIYESGVGTLPVFLEFNQSWKCHQSRGSSPFTLTHNYIRACCPRPPPNCLIKFHKDVSFANGSLLFCVRGERSVCVGLCLFARRQTVLECCFWMTPFSSTAIWWISVSFSKHNYGPSGGIVTTVIPQLSPDTCIPRCILCYNYQILAHINMLNEQERQG